MPFEFEKQKIEDVILVKPKIYGDNRGFFMESYKKSDFYNNGIKTEFLQDNYSKSSARVLRGLHYQANPFGQAKLVRCTKGRIYDIAVDIRPQSKTFKQYIKVELSETNNYMLFIPEGFAHGFVVLSDIGQLLMTEVNIALRTFCNKAPIPFSSLNILPNILRSNAEPALIL